MQRDLRRAQIVSAALMVACRDGLAAVDAAMVARECRPAVSVRTVRRLVGKQKDLWIAVADAARDGGMGLLVAEADRLGIK